MKTVRIGVIGCGMIAKVGHLPCFDRNSHCEITEEDPLAVISRRPTGR